MMFTGQHFEKVDSDDSCQKGKDIMRFHIIRYSGINIKGRLLIYQINSFSQCTVLLLIV